MGQYSTNHTKKRKRRKRSSCLTVILAFEFILLAAVIAVLFFYTQGPALYKELTVEAGEALPPAEAFLKKDQKVQIAYVTDLARIKTNVPGEYPVELEYKREGLFKRNIICKTVIRIKDTVAPKANTKDLTVPQQNLPAAEEFVTEVQDATEVTVRYKTEPDPEKTEPQPVTILLTDAGGNTTELQAMLTVIIDHVAPAIQGVKDIYLYEGDTVAYRNGISVTDDQDPSPVLTVDTSGVDLSASGVYEAIYTATDFAGNSTSVTAKVTVYEKRADFVSVDIINEAADSLLESIIRDGMTDREKVESIYWWIEGHCGYVNHSDKANWMQAAYTMLKDRQGDCFNYFSLCKLMLERLGIPNIDVEKIPNYNGDSHHYWSLVSVDGGQSFYHVDCTPRIGNTIDFLLVTDAVMDSYSDAHNHCFNRDQSLYPATPEE